MSCGCKKKPSDQPQAPQAEQTPSTTPTPAQTQEQVIKVSTVLREMIENKKL